MPWNDNQGGGGGGPWGSGGGNNNGQNPWGQRPQGGGGGGQQPPDLDEVVRQMQDSLRKWFGGSGSGGDGKKGGGGAGAVGFSLIILVLIGIWFATSGIYQVGPNQNGVVLRFGEYNRTTQPGLHFKLPTPIETVLRPEVTTTQSLTIGNGPEGQMLTRDQNIVDIDFAVQWRVDLSYADGVRDYLFNVRNPEGTVRAVSESAMREVIGTSELEFIITDGRGEVSRRTRELVQETLNEYEAGIQILQINLQTAQPPAKIGRAHV